MSKPFWKQLDKIVGVIFIVGIAIYFLGGQKDCEAINKEIVAELKAEIDAIDERKDVDFWGKQRLKQKLSSAGTMRGRMKEAGCEKWFLDVS